MANTITTLLGLLVLTSSVQAGEPDAITRIEGGRRVVYKRDIVSDINKREAGIHHGDYLVCAVGVQGSLSVKTTPWSRFATSIYPS